MKAVIFDMDGVIFDSEKAIADLWVRLAGEKRLDRIEEAVCRCIGINDAATKAVFKEMYGDDFPYEEYKSVISERFHSLYDGGRLPMKPGIRELLIYLKQAGFAIALASSSKRVNVVNQLRDAGLLDYFSVVIGGDMVIHSKPDPEIFLAAAGELGIPAKECYVIEDSYNGIRAAHRAEMTPIMVPDLLQPDDEIRALARNIFPSLTEVEEYLRKESFSVRRDSEQTKTETEHIF